MKRMLQGVADAEAREEAARQTLASVTEEISKAQQALEILQVQAATARETIARAHGIAADVGAAKAARAARTVAEGELNSTTAQLEMRQGELAAAEERIVNSVNVTADQALAAEALARRMEAETDAETARGRVAQLIRDGLRLEAIIAARQAFLDNLPAVTPPPVKTTP